MPYYVVKVDLDPFATPRTGAIPITCPIAGDAHKRGHAPFYLFTEFAIPKEAFGQKDFVHAYQSFLLSSKAKRAFENAKLTGWKTQSISSTVPERQAQEFSLFRATDFLGAVAKDAGLHATEQCPGCGFSRYQIDDVSRVVDPAVVAGHDFFLLWPMTGYIFASQRVKDVCRDADLVGLQFISIDDLYPKGMPREFSPSRELSDLFEPEQALYYQHEFPTLPLSWPPIVPGI